MSALFAREYSIEILADGGRDFMGRRYLLSGEDVITLASSGVVNPAKTSECSL
jgi:hypothetical protein